MLCARPGRFLAISLQAVSRSAGCTRVSPKVQVQITRGPVHKAAMVQCSTNSLAAEPRQSLSVAVIGAGAAGLVAARELVQEGHHVTVFEKGCAPGGVWVYTDEVEAPDLLGKDPNRRLVHSSMYAKLRTNLPREVMAYTDFAFDDLAGQSKDPRRFPSHEEVLRYLQAFAAAFQLNQYVQFNTEVVSAVPLTSDSQQHQDQQRLQSNQHASSSGRDTSLTNGESHGDESQLPWPKWRITTKAVPKRKLPSSNEHLVQQEQSNGSYSNHNQPTNGVSHQDTTQSNGHAHTDRPPADSLPQAPSTATKPSDAQTDNDSQTATYDALVVCNGHYSTPRCPDVKGSRSFPGQVMHSHNYRENEAFQGQVVVLVGASASGEDICREIAEVADKVYLCARSWQNPDWAKETKPFGHQHNIWRRPVPSELHKDGSVTFTDGQHVDHVDTVMYCTGYLYTFPFLDKIVSTTDNRVSPVYRHIFPVSTAPTLAIIGLPWKVVPFPEFEVQAKWIARVLSNRVSLPSSAAMQAEVEQFYEDLEREGVAVRYTHLLGDKQWEYKDWISEQCGPDVAKTEPWRRQMYEATGQNKREFPDRYRDVWRDDHLVEVAKQEFKKQSASLRAG